MSGKKHNNKKWNIVWKSGIVCMLLFVICGICIKFGFQPKENHADPDDGTTITRGVVNSVGDLPDTKRTGSDKALGTKQNPFLILEIVPNKDYAEIGYLISGCEPDDAVEAADDYFLKDTLGLTDEKADKYSVVVKTITPSELDSKKEWIDYADLVYISQSEGGSDTFKDNDFSWAVAKKLFMKATDREKYCGIILDESVCDVESFDSKNVTFNVCDWFGKATTKEVTKKGSNNNVYKLAVMLTSMDPYAFRSIYFQDDEAYIEGGEFKVQSGNAKTYWTAETFLPSRADGATNDLDSYWQSDAMWDGYNISSDSNDKKRWTVGRVHVISKSKTILESYEAGAGDWCKDFSGFKKYVGGSSATTAEAVSYILDADAHTEVSTASELYILDLEPSVDIKSGYTVTEDYFRWLIPSYTGEIKITHQTTAEFVGKIEDLNSEYDLIYMGLDCGAYNLDSDGYPDWNDNNLDGMIYLHTGDVVYSSEYNVDDSVRSRSVKWLYNNANTNKLRFSGNDITSLKKKDLEDFLKAGQPIVLAQDLYDLANAPTGKPLVDKQSYIYKFINGKKGDSDNLCSTADVANILKAMQNKKPILKLDQSPAQYKGTTSGGTLTANYLPTSGGKAYLKFGFHVESPVDGVTYGYRIYMDKNRDGKLASGEKIVQGTFDGSKKEVTRFLSATFIGVVQWKIEVYRTDNTSLRSEITGFSAVKKPASQPEKEIRVLQIMPKSGIYDGAIDLSTNPLFNTYFDALNEYNITVDSITVTDYENYFKNNNEGKKFSFDKSKDISNETGSENPKNYTPTLDGIFSNYNMIIVGFGDAYGFWNISNDYGAIDYLDYYIAQGRSILLTHDLTSLYNIPFPSGALPFGYSPNTLLRDVMGMNRYGAINTNLSSDKITSIKNYQTGKKYDKAVAPDGSTYSEIQGFTYYAMKRLAWGSNDNVTAGYKMPFQYMIKGPTGELTCNKNETTKRGFNNNNDLTTKLSQVNKGQITEYPYYIDPNAEIAATHAQWYQLNLEDGEITVWYTLANDNKAIAYHGGDSNQKGTALTYGVSPNDAANNYYIYSKDNVFYSGVGHSTNGGNLTEMETKLFINTMIAAYRQSYEPPEVTITNSNAKESEDVARTYSIALPKEYDEDSSGAGGNTVKGENFTDTDVQRVSFEINDYNLDASFKECEIYYSYTEGGVDKKDYIPRIYDESGTVYTPNGDNKYTGLTFGKTYYFDYPKKYLSEWTDVRGTHPAYRVVKFDVMNDKISSTGTTTLNMAIQALFQLD